MTLLACVSYDVNEIASFQFQVYVVLEQVKPDIVLTSSKSDDTFVVAVSDHSASDFNLKWLYASYLSNLVDAVGNTFQMRPFKEFVTIKGRDRLLSLSRFTDFTEDSDLPPSSDDSSNSSRPTNAYDFMRLRPGMNGDPTTKRWNASIRLANFASVESSPLCVRLLSLCQHWAWTNAQTRALLDYLVRERALGGFDDDGVRGLDIKDIEILAL
jgi:DNA mismatch repair protein MSH5